MENFVFEEPDGSSGDTLVAAAVLGALVREVCREFVMVISSSYRLTVRFPDIIPARKGAECVLFTLAGRVVLRND